MRLASTILLLVLSALAFGATMQVADTASGVRFQFQGTDSDDAAWSQTTVALPASEARLVVHSMTIASYDQSGTLIGRDNAIDMDRVVLSNTFTMREMHGFTVQTETRRETADGYEIVENADFELVPTRSITMPTHVSEAFAPSYKALAANYDTCYLRNLPYAQPSLLILSHNGQDETIAGFLQWKRSLGFHVEVLHREDYGTPFSAVQSGIAQYYQSCADKPDFFLIIGDTNGTYEVPTDFINSGDAFNATDLSYALIEGADYFPEMIVGRFSCDIWNDIATQLGKTISYESNPYMTDTSWMTRALVVAGNRSNTLPPPTTPVLMSRWLVHELYDAGYTEVDTVFYPPTYPGTTEITTNLNAGNQFVSYRGWGAAEGWHYPLFHSSDLDGVSNGRRMPIVTSIVCNTGDFASEDQDPNFGEKWMRKGTPSTPDGCIAFVGPSDLHTSTEYNNNIAGGLYQSVLRENVRGFGAAVLRGKIELYNNYPLNINDAVTAKTVNFYYHVYNVLSDPTLRMWFRVPVPFSINLPSSIEQGTTGLQIDLPGQDGAVVTATRNGIDFTRAVVENGVAILPVDAQATGSLTVTISRDNRIPKIATINVVAATTVGVSAYSYSDILAGTNVTMNVTAVNYTAAAIENVTATFASDSPYFVSSNGMFNFGTLAAGATANASLAFGIAANCPDNEPIVFSLVFSTGREIKYSVLVNANAFETVSATVAGDGVLAPGETADITVTIANLGSHTVSGLNGHLIPSTTAVTVTSADGSFGSIAAGASATATFTVTAAATASKGRDARFRLDLTDDANRTAFTYVSTTIGPVDHTTPTGPDEYGYFIYDNTDVSSNAPTYTWHEIDPDNGGTGTVVPMLDDVSFIVDLPFTFRFYGVDYNKVTVCSNGWIACGDQKYHNDFRNWNIPAALGPDPLIAPYWDDLKGYMSVDSTTALMNLIYKVDANQAVFQWHDAYSQFNNSSIEQFEVVLTPVTNEDGDIQFNYHTIDNPDADNNFATVGIENVNHAFGLKYSYAGMYPPTATPLANGLALRITTTAPDDVVGNDTHATVPPMYALEQNSPNPFNPETAIAFSLAENANVSLRVFDTRGRLVRTLVNNEAMPAGSHTVNWNGTNDSRNPVASGVYFYEMRGGKYTSVKKMILLK
jgi:hypothetical protein